MRDGSFEHTKKMFKLMDMKILTILRPMFLVIWRPVAVSSTASQRLKLSIRKRLPKTVDCYTG